MRYAFSSLNAFLHSSIHSNAFILVVLFLVIVRWGMIIVEFAATCLSFWSSGCCSFHWPNFHSSSWFRWVSRSTATIRVCTCLSKALGRFPISWLMVAIDHLDHATLCLRRGDMVNHSFPTNGTNWWCTKLPMSWSSIHVPMGVPEEQKRRTKQRAPVRCQPKTLWRLS